MLNNFKFKTSNEHIKVDPYQQIILIDKDCPTGIHYIENEKERIINEKTRVEVNDIIESRKIESFRSLEDIQKSVNNIIDLDVENIYKNNLDLIDKIIKTKDYDKLLEVCNLKKEITRKLANKYLDSNYENKAIEYLNTNKTLQELFIKKYLQELAEY